MKDGKRTDEDRATGIIRNLLERFREETGKDLSELELLEMLSGFFASLAQKEKSKVGGFRYKPQMFDLLQAFDWDKEDAAGMAQKFEKIFEELPEEDKQEIIKQVYRRPQNFIMLPAKPVTVVFSGNEALYDPDTEDERGGLEIRVAKKKQEDITVYTQLSLPIIEDGAPLQFPKVLTVYDKNVFLGICSSYEDQQRRGAYPIGMTDKQIYQAMTGTTGDPSKAALNKVRASVKRLRACFITLDYSKQAQLYGLDGINTYYHDYNMVYAEGGHIETGGKIVEGYVILHEPILLSYAKAVKQIATIEQKYLLVPINNTDNNIAIKNYLLEYISGLKNKKTGLSPVLAFNTIYEHSGLKPEDLTKTQRNRLKQTVLKCLEYWREPLPGEPGNEHTGFIKGYAEAQLSSRKRGVEIRA